MRGDMVVDGLANFGLGKGVGLLRCEFGGYGFGCWVGSEAD